MIEMFKEKPLMSIKDFIKLVENTVDTKAVEGGFKLSQITNVPIWDDNSFWVVETTIEEDLQAIIIELEKQNAEILELTNIFKMKLI